MKTKEEWLTIACYLGYSPRQRGWARMIFSPDGMKVSGLFGWQDQNQRRKNLRVFKRFIDRLRAVDMPLLEWSTRGGIYYAFGVEGDRPGGVAIASGADDDDP